MSTGIVSDICPPPEWNLAEEDVQQMVDELERYYQEFRPAFERRDQAAHGWVYLKGLLSDLPRKVTERIALRFGVNVRSLQHFMGQSTWRCEELLKRHQAQVVETLGEEDGVVLVDECGLVKQGEHSVGVGHQWCGSVGKVANAQVGVYLGYASRKGHSFLDARLFLPEAWFAEAHQALRQACGVPEALSFQTKPEIALALLEKALPRGELPCQWVTADALYGDSSLFRDGIAALDKWYFVEVRCTTRIWLERPEVAVPPWQGRGRRPTRLRVCDPKQKALQVDDLAQQLPQAAWVRAKIKEGAKGPLVCDFACLRVIVVRVDLPGQELWLVIRRHLQRRQCRIGLGFLGPLLVAPVPLNQFQQPFHAALFLGGAVIGAVVPNRFALGSEVLGALQYRLGVGTDLGLQQCHLLLLEACMSLVETFVFLLQLGYRRVFRWPAVRCRWRQLFQCRPVLVDLLLQRCQFAAHCIQFYRHRARLGQIRG